MTPDILLVEDSATDVELIMFALRQEGAEGRVCVARDGAQAWQTLVSDVEPPRVILLDLKLPKLDGVDLLKRIRARESMRHVPVVMLSSSDLPSDIRRCYEAGANGYVVKPVNFDDLVTAMRQLCGFWLHLNRTFGASEA